MADQATTPKHHQIAQWNFDLADEVWEVIAPELATNSNAIDEALVEDCAAAAELGALAGTQIADDMRRRVYARLRARRPVLARK